MQTLILLALAAGAYGQLSFQCPENFGDYADSEYCDYYWRCNQGTAESLRCEDGHVFLPSLRGSLYPCDYAFKGNCTTRPLLQEAQPGPDPECPRQHGIFADSELCDTFYVCKDGIATRTQCSPGLHFDLVTRDCIWPHQANRGECSVRESLDGFQCPVDAINAVDLHGNRNLNPSYIHEDCRYFYVCLNGVKPTLAGCPDGTVYNEVTAKCDDPKNVKGCENYYNEHPVSVLSAAGHAKVQTS